MALVSSSAASQEEELRRLMPPPPPRPPGTVTAPQPKPPVVLDEDTYTQQLDAIIERDYFPELPKMANQLEWLRAVNSGDIREMQRAQRNIARRRAAAAATAASGLAAIGATPALGGETPGGALPPFATPGSTAVGAGWGAATPGTALPRTPAMTPAVGVGGGGDGLGERGAAPAVAADVAAGVGATAALVPTGLSLDSFLQRYTSEDNASFQAILQVRHHLERPDPRDPETRKLLLEGPKERPSDEFGTTGQSPMTLLPAPEPVVNSLFYDSSQRPAVPFSSKELAAQALGPPKAINKTGTRLKAPPEAPPPPGPAAVAAAAAALAAAVESGAEGAIVAAAAAAAATAAGLPLGAPLPAAVGGGTAGYAPMATPALDDVLSSPLMTWGDIESTPLRLGADDMPVALDEEALAGGGPSFRVQSLTEREQAAHRLAAAKAGSGTAASRAVTARGSTPLLAALKRLATGGRTTGDGAGATARSGGTGSGATPLAVPLSPAARQLVANIKAGGGTHPRAAAGTSAVTATGHNGYRGGGHARSQHHHPGNRDYRNHHRSGGRGGGGGRDGGRGGGSAAAAAAAAAASASAARSLALGSGELDRQLRASYQSVVAPAGDSTPGHGGTPVAGRGATRAAVGARRTPVVVGVKRTPGMSIPRDGGQAAAGTAGLDADGGSGVGRSGVPQSVTDDLLKL